MKCETCQKLRGKVGRLTKELAECYRLTGADSDGNTDAMLAEHAVSEVRRLRRELDEERAK